MKPIIQSRWKLIELKDGIYLKYFGDYLNTKYTEKCIKLVNKKIVNLIREFDGNKNLEDIVEYYKYEKEYSQILNQLQSLIKIKAIVDITELRKPVIDEEKRICTKCVNNNHIIEDLEFDENGVCDYCRFYESQVDYSYIDMNSKQNVKLLVSGNKSKYDVMVLFTGDKESSFLLWYLAKKLELRVLASTWIMPFMQNSARENIYSAMKMLPNVEFVQQAVPWDELQELMKLTLLSKGSPCLCHFMNKLLFYPIAIREQIPFVYDGIGQTQTIFLD